MKSLLSSLLMPRVVRCLVYVTSPKFTAGAMVVWVDGADVLLVRSRHGERKWGFPGGTLNRHEQPVQGALRELREEAGVADIDDAELVAVGTHTQEHASHIETVFKLVRDRMTSTAGPNPPNLPGSDRFEIDQVRWWPAASLPDLRREALFVVEKYPSIFAT